MTDRYIPSTCKSRNNMANHAYIENIVLTAVSLKALKCFHSTPAGVLSDSWLVPSPENSSEALFFSQVQFSIANGELANGQGQPCVK